MSNDTTDASTLTARQLRSAFQPETVKSNSFFDSRFNSLVCSHQDVSCPTTQTVPVSTVKSEETISSESASQQAMRVCLK